MTAALVTLTQSKLSPDMSIEFVRCYLTSTGDWYNSKLGTVIGCVAEGDAHMPTAISISGQTITISAAGATYLSLIIWGKS